MNEMDGLRIFLESSSIHGLSYISSRNKGIQLFWILVVTFGFSAAGFLIIESFQSWAESPVKTTIETLPISDLKFPKVTVCPPKNTFTDLNYDVMMTENISLNSEGFQEFKNYVQKLHLSILYALIILQVVGYIKLVK